MSFLLFFQNLGRFISPPETLYISTVARPSSVAMLWTVSDSFEWSIQDVPPAGLWVAACITRRLSVNVGAYEGGELRHIPTKVARQALITWQPCQNICHPGTAMGSFA